MSDLVFTLDDSTPTPPSGTASIYAKSDGLFYTKDDAGVETALKGDTGATGPAGATGAGVPTGGTTGQILAKDTNTDYDTSWYDADLVYPQTVSLTGDSTLGIADQSVEVNSASPCTITLPAASSMLSTILTNQHCKRVTIFNTGSTAVTVAGDGSDTINGASTAVLQFQWSSITLHPNHAGTGWMIV